MAAHPELVAQLTPYDEGRVPAVTAAPARRDGRHVPAVHLLDWPRCAEGAASLRVVPAPQVLDARRAYPELQRERESLCVCVCVCVCVCTYIYMARSRVQWVGM